MNLPETGKLANLDLLHWGVAEQMLTNQSIMFSIVFQNYPIHIFPPKTYFLFNKPGQYQIHCTEVQ